MGRPAAQRVRRPCQNQLVDKSSLDRDALVPCIVRDSRTGEVLTLAYVNDEALAHALRPGRCGSGAARGRSSGTRGRPRGTSRLKALRYDCDEDAWLALVEPAGPACHTGERTCFYRGDMDTQPAEALPVLERVIERDAPPTRPTATRPRCWPSPRIGEKVEEEAEEAARAAREESGERLAEEAADVLYHLSVLLASRGLTLSDAYEVLGDRRGR